MDLFAIIAVVVLLCLLAVIAYVLTHQKRGMSRYYCMGDKYCMLEDRRWCTDGDCRKCVFAYVAYDYTKNRKKESN